MSEIKKRTRKAITKTVEKLIDKYGLETVRPVVNSYFTMVCETVKLNKDVAEKEKELALLKKKLGR